MDLPPQILHLYSINMKTQYSTLQQKNGILFFIRVGQQFAFHWTFEDDKAFSDSFMFYSPFYKKVSSLSTLFLTLSPIGLILIPNNGEEPIVFTIENTEVISLGFMLECIIQNFVAFPNPNKKHTFFFNTSSSFDPSEYIPPNIHMKISPTMTIDELWPSILEYYQKLILFLNDTNCLPSSYIYSISLGAQCVNNEILNSIHSEIAQWPKYSQITSEEFPSLFDSEGKIIDPDLFKRRLYHGGAEPSIFCQIIPFAVGLFPIDSTTKDREKIKEQLQKQYDLLKYQVETTSSFQVSSCIRIKEAFRVIDQDVDRTDRTLDAFKRRNGPAHAILRFLLRVYALYSPRVSYLQGMNDIFVPIMLSFLPKWAEGVPVDENGEPINTEPIMHFIFGCYDSLLNNTQQCELYIDINQKCLAIAEKVLQLLHKISPLIEVWLTTMGLQSLLWCYTDFVLIFKRTYSNIWPLWFQFNISPEPSNWLVYYTTAIFLEGFKKLSEMNDISIPAMMTQFPLILQSLDRETLGKLALWIYRKNLEWKILPKQTKSSIKQQSPPQFHYFEANLNQNL